MTHTGQYTVVVEGYHTTDTGAYAITATVSPAPTIPASTASKVVTCQTCLNGASEGDSDPAADANPSNPTESPGNLDAGVENLASNAESGNAAGAPVNFDVGYQQQPEIDYNAGGLIFTRIYRSDSSWTNNTIGTPLAAHLSRARSASSAPLPPSWTRRAPRLSSP